MKTLDKIPTGKFSRTSKLVSTGAKIGGNYLKYYSKKAFNPELDRSELDESNATDIYDSLKDLKGSALKVAQMLSMEKNMLPNAYVEKFSLAQFSVPPLSGPLVRKTFKKYLGKYPEDLYDNFTPESVNAASIGQVHQAHKDGKKLAVKIQYPGVAESISSDLKLVKPVALKMFNIKGKDADKYFKEVESKLLEETDYILEIEQSKKISEACSEIPNLLFPKYYPALSSEKIITMDWMQGIHISEFAKTDFSKEAGNQIGQALWNFYMYQIHHLKEVHADPHPGNFLVNDQHQLIAIDFGCVKQIPDDFYIPYFELAIPENIENDSFFEKKLVELEILKTSDQAEEKAFFKKIFYEMLSLFTQPFHSESFDFGDDVFWNNIADLSEKFSSDKQLRKMDGSRGSKHFLYINRTFFGLYNLLNDLNAEIKINDYKRFI
ncbi:MAG: ABC1 kinase family protein [Bacteroidota bacterium]